MSKGKNFIGLTSSVVMIIAVFLPWLKVSSSASFMGYSSSFSAGAISGFNVGDAWFALIISIVAIVLTLKNIKWAVICGAVNLIIALGFIVGWRSYNAGTSVSFESSYGSASASIDVQGGIYLLALAALVLIVSTIKDFTTKVESLPLTPQN